MESFATPYPVIFQDGEREHDKGHIGVHSVLTFKRFQALLSQKVGLPAGQVAAVFVCRRSAKDTDTKRQKLPINENTNFNIILNQHNPKSEKNCYFLVSMKKSKKERKGSRRRSAETENGDDCSVSPRGDSTPDNEEVCKEEECIEPNEAVPLPETASENGHRVEMIREKEFDCESQGSFRYNSESMNQERLECTGSPKPIFRSPAEVSPKACSSSPRSPQSAQFSPFLDTGALSVNTKSQGSSPQASLPWLNNGASSDLRPSGDKIFLRRDMNNLAGPVVGWQNRDKAVEIHGSARHITDTHGGSDKAWQNGEPLDVRPTLLRNDHKWASAQQFQQRSIEGLPQDRYSDPLLMRSPVLLQRNGILNLSGTSTPFAGLPATRPLGFTPMDSTILPRVSSGISGLAPGSNAVLNLQQAQAQYLNLQAQQSEQMYLNLQALSKIRGVVRGLAAYENGNHKPSGVCQHCFRFQERKINPTPFHLCVHDRITNGFRGPSPAGPIERPGKRVEAAA